VHTSRLSQLAIAIATVAAVLFVGVPLIGKMGALPSRVSFPLFLFGGGGLGLIGLLLALVALFTTRPATGRAGRGLAWSATGLCAVVVAGLALAAGPGIGRPPINDITTDFADPPQFSSPDKPYPGESFAKQQRAAYPDLAPIDVDVSPDEALRMARSQMVALGWQIAAESPSTGTIEATDTSRTFHFVDDIAVRVRPKEGGGSRIDVRSKSREGKGDLGANAARIARLRDRIREAQ
jgi:uncharacterized protein (DUF1499 family)